MSETMDPVATEMEQQELAQQLLAWDHCLPVSPTRAMMTARSERSAGLRWSRPADMRLAGVDVPPAAHAGEGWRTRLAWRGGLKREGAGGRRVLSAGSSR
jgi:hypothetical protein